MSSNNSFALDMQSIKIKHYNAIEKSVNTTKRQYS